MKYPQISIVIPLYNKELSIKNTINSVLNQDYANFELLIINDGSTDSSLKIIGEFNDERIRIISTENGGVSRARNKGIKEAKYDFIFLLDGDDIIDHDCLDYFSDSICKNPTEDIFCCNFRVENENELVRSRFCESLLPGVIKKPIKLIWENKFMTRTGTLLFNKRRISIVDYFNPLFSYYEDMDFILRLLKGNKIVYIDKVLFSYKLEFNSLSEKSPKLESDWLYNMNILGGEKYDSYIKSRILFNEIIKRFKVGAISSAFLLIRKHHFTLFFVLYVKLLGLFKNK